MMIKFQSKGTAPFEMRSEHALPLIGFMGHNKQEEGSVSGDALVTAQNNLNKGLSQHSEPEPEVDDDEDDWDKQDKEEVISLATRATPLKDMIKHAIDNDSYVMWQKT